MNRVQKSKNRSSSRLKLYQKINSCGSRSLPICLRCRVKQMDCVSSHGSSCSNCVLSGMGKGCESQLDETDCLLLEKRLALENAIREVSRLMEEVKQLEVKARSELEILMNDISSDAASSCVSNASSSDRCGSLSSISSRRMKDTGTETDPLSPAAWASLPVAESSEAELGIFDGMFE